jgi:hypothetical protein
LVKIESSEIPQNDVTFKIYMRNVIDLPCDAETAGLEQLRESAIRDELPGESDESSRCLLFIFVTVPQFEVFVDALSAININIALIRLSMTQSVYNW